MTAKLPLAARALCDYRARHYLSPFLARENTLAGACEVLRVTPQRMSYWIAKLLKLRLLKFVRYDKQSRHRRAIYRSIDNAYTVPFSALDDADLARLLTSTQSVRFKQLQLSMLRNLRKHKARLQLRMWHDGSGPFDAIENPNASEDYFGIANETYPLFLDAHEVKQLHSDLRILLAKYYALSQRTKPAPVMLYIGLAEDPIWSTQV
jgi:hypothetical protein